MQLANSGEMTQEEKIKHKSTTQTEEGDVTAETAGDKESKKILWTTR